MLYPPYPPGFSHAQIIRRKLQIIYILQPSVISFFLNHNITLGEKSLNMVINKQIYPDSPSMALISDIPSFV
jgi:hypothetical protein